MAFTRAYFGGVRLDLTRIEWPLYRGWDARVVTVRQLASRRDEFAALPYVNTLRVENTAETGVAGGGGESTEIHGLRLVEIRKIDGEVCEFDFADCRFDLQDRVCPADVNVRWKDGWLANTRFQALPDLFRYLAPLIQTLEDVLAPDAFEDMPDGDEYDLPLDERLAGMPLPDAGARMTELLGLDPVVGTDGKLRFVQRGTTEAFPVEGYNWVLGGRPSWGLESRTPRGLPRIIRSSYWERHAILMSNGTISQTASGLPRELEVQLEQVYAFGGKYGRLTELLEWYGYDRFAIKERDIGRHVTSLLFEGTAIEVGKSQNAARVAAIIKRDWRHLWRLYYPNNIGRRGGWTDMVFGRFEQSPNKDSEVVYTGDVSGAPVRMEHAIHLARVESGEWPDQTTIQGNVVYDSVLKQGSSLPDAPFTVAWESEPEQVVRLVPNIDPSKALHVFPGRITNYPQGKARITRESELVGGEIELPMNAGTLPGLPADLTHIPTDDDLMFDEPNFRLQIFAVATRRLPNTADRWWRVDSIGFVDGDQEVFETEVGTELYALRDYVNPGEEGHFAMPDGLGPILNENDLTRDAQRRNRVVRDTLGNLQGGSGTCIGTAPIQDMPFPRGAVKEIRLSIDGVAVTTEVIVGRLDNEQARESRRRLREANRRAVLGGKVIA